MPSPGSPGPFFEAPGGPTQRLNTSGPRVLFAGHENHAVLTYCLERLAVGWVFNSYQEFGQ